MKARDWLSAVLLIVLSGAAPAHGDPRVWQSDVRINGIDVGESRPGTAVNVRIVVAADGEDAAKAARVEILLPIGVSVLRLTDGCRTSPSPVTGLNARVTCDLGDLAVHGTREIVIATSARRTPGATRFAAFAFSDTPDPSPANNYAERVIQ